jgi:hypothetical protein
VCPNFGLVTNTSDQALTSLIQSRQLPLGPFQAAPDFIEAVGRLEIPEEWEPWCDERGYTPLSALALIADDEAGRFGVNRDAAAKFAAHVLKVGPHWKQISADSEKVAENRELAGSLHVFLAAFGREGSDKFTYDIGTLPELAETFKHDTGCVHGEPDAMRRDHAQARQRARHRDRKFLEQGMFNESTLAVRERSPKRPGSPPKSRLCRTTP